MDHGFGAGGQGLVIADQAAVEHNQPRVRSATQRRGRAVNPLVAGSRRTTSTSMPRAAPPSMTLVR